MKFANMIVNYERESKRQRNYGDDIQLLAIENLYNYMNIPYEEIVRIKTTDIFSYDGEPLILPINYPFYGCYSKLSPYIFPVFLGISLLSGAVGDSLRLNEFQPIGCRDLYTYNELIAKGYRAYLNGCMTLTFPRRKNTGNGEVFFVDVCDELLPYIPEEIKKRAKYSSHLFYNKYITEEDARKVYDNYKKNADLVVTSRLHCAVPCLAAGIPVIYACKKISFRSIWLENILPLYSLEDFSEINWYPESVEIESIKENMLENAKNQVLSVYQRYIALSKVNKLFFNKKIDTFYFESLESSMRYMELSWEDKTFSYEYIIWGITQTAEILYEYIQTNYQNAKLVGVIDVYRQMLFHGIQTDGLELLEKSHSATVFVAVESANKMAIDVFQRYNIQNYVLCWEKLDYKL